jgi:hypothetical protein
MPDPIFILAAPRSFTSVVCAMLGQHPQLHGLPETHLFMRERMSDWFARVERETFPMDHGLLRAVAELCFGQQTELTVSRARGWLRRRATFTTGIIFEELAYAASPRHLVDKSPSIVYQIESMRRIFRLFPHARFVHLVRHPRGYCESVLNYFDLLSRRHGFMGEGPVTDWWIRRLAYFNRTEPDPQMGWYELNKNISAFLASVPKDQAVTVQGEALLTDPDRELYRVLRKLDLRSDANALERMKHPEHSPYASFGPRGARYGNDVNFLERPALEPMRAQPHTLDGPLAWLDDGRGFLPEVKQLAHRFGYD